VVPSTTGWWYRQQEQQIAAEEAGLAQALTDLKMRTGPVRYVNLQRALHSAKIELDERSRQLAALRKVFGHKGKMGDDRPDRLRRTVEEEQRRRHWPKLPFLRQYHW